jgi:hypothetical protein
MMELILPARPMVNMLFNKLYELYELYWALAQMGLGLGGVAYDLSPLERGALRARGQLD